MNKNKWNSILLREVLILLGITVFNKKESIENANLNKSKKTIKKACHIRFANKFQQQNQIKSNNFNKNLVQLKHAFAFACTYVCA